MPSVYAQGHLTTAAGEEIPWPRLGVIGDPIHHSASPLLHRAALRASAEPGDYLAIRVHPADLRDALGAAHAAGMLGLNVTLPHKETAAAYCVELAAVARDVGAVNTMVRTNTGWHGHNTDVAGLRSALQRCFPSQPWKGETTIVGGGGAAKAALMAMGQLGSPNVRVLVRRQVDWPRRHASVEILNDAPDLRATRLLVQATPLGLQPEDPSPIDVDRLDPACAVMDLTYGQDLSRLIVSARARGIDAVDGRAMLVAQAADAFALWFPGQDVFDAMSSAMNEPS